MIFLYNIGVRAYSLIVRLAALFGNKKAKLWVLGRKYWTENIKTISSKKDIQWFHCASLGEFEQAKPVIEKIKELYPQLPILITFFSPSGYEIRKNYELADCVMYLPVDTPKNARKFVSALSISNAYFVKYELWYNYFDELKTQNIPLYLISALFREEQFSKIGYGRLLKRLLSFPNHIFAQKESTVSLLNTQGFNNVSLTGDTRIDRVYETTQNTIDLPVIKSFVEGGFVIVAGSSWQQEEELLAKLVGVVDSNVKFIIAPHDIGKNRIKAIHSTFGNKCIDYSFANPNNVKENQILIIDEIGLLSEIYSFGDIAFIGGGFSGNLHNILEAVAFGVPVTFGPNYDKFPEATEIIRSEIGRVSFDYATLESYFNLLYKNSEVRDNIKQNASLYIEENRGATQQIVDYVFK